MTEQKETAEIQIQSGELTPANNNTLPKDPRYPLKVLYCGACGLPPEFCEYGPNFEKCKPWLAQNCPTLYPDLNTYQGQSSHIEEKMSEMKIEDNVKQKDEEDNDNKNENEDEDTEDENEKESENDDEGSNTNKKAIKTKKGQILSEEEKKKVKILPGGKVKPKEPNQIIISRTQRAKRKYITTVVGLGSFGIKLTDASKLFSKRFSCGSGPSKSHEDTVEVQGDFSNEIVDFILNQWKDKIKPDQIFFLEEGKKRPAKG